MGIVNNSVRHVFRYTHASMAEQAGMPLSDRPTQLGHGGLRMTRTIPMPISILPGERRRDRVLAAEEDTRYRDAATHVGDSILNG